MQQDVLSLADLLQDVAEDSPSGCDLRLDVTPHSLYFRLRDARSEARADERAADNDPAAAESGSRHWKAVRSLAIEALAGSTKDMEIAAWLTESLVRSDGLLGLTAGARLLQGLVEQFWDRGLHPLPDGDDTEGRTATVAGLNGQSGNGTLAQPLRKITLFERDDGSPLSFWQFEQAEEVAAIGNAPRRTQRLAAGALPLDELEARARAGGKAHLAGIGRDAHLAASAWLGLEAALASAAGSAAPSMRRVHDLLDKIRSISERYAGPVVMPQEEAAPAAEGAVAPEAAGVVQQAMPTFADRECLLGEVSRIAALFRTSEPNAPIGYTLDEAVRRARLAWPELLREMMPDPVPRSALLSSLGIRPVLE